MAQKKDTFFMAPKAGKLTHADKSGRPKTGFKERPKKSVPSESVETKTKKPFDKKTYRLKKYSNKYKLEKWEDQRKKKLLRNYYKDVKNEAPSGTYKPINFDDDGSDSEDSKSTEETTNAGRFVRHPDSIQDELDKIEPVPEDATHKQERPNHSSKMIKKDAFWKAKTEFSRLKQSKQEKKQKIENSKKERAEKMMEYRKKKAERFKKLSRKTKKGQPVMTGRLELLLEKIVKNK